MTANSPSTYGISLTSLNFSLGRGVSSLSVVVRVASARACVGWMRPPWMAGTAAGEIYTRVEWSAKAHDVGAVGS